MNTTKPTSTSFHIARSASISAPLGWHYHHTDKKARHCPLEGFLGALCQAIGCCAIGAMIVGMVCVL